MKYLLINIIGFYRKFISTVLVSLFGKACRFTPTCSEYTIEALEKFGVLRGLPLGIKRFSRCHALGGSGFDPAPNRIG